jgi:hypothetical protein
MKSASRKERDMRDVWMKGELGGTGKRCGQRSAANTDADTGAEEKDNPDPPEIKPPLPNEVPAPQPSIPDIAPFQTPPPADPGLPQPQA